MDKLQKDLSVFETLTQINSMFIDLTEYSETAQATDQTVHEKYRTLKNLLNTKSRTLSKSVKSGFITEDEIYFLQPAVNGAIEKLPNRIGCANTSEFRDTLHDAMFDIEYCLGQLIQPTASKKA